MPSPSSSMSGFSAIELAIVLALAAVLAGMALPDLRGLLQQQRLRLAAGEMRAAIELARVEGLRRGGGVGLRKAEAAECPPGPANDWSCGWDVVAADPATPQAETLLQSWPPTRGIQVTMQAPPPQNRLQVNRWGRFGSLNAFSVLLQRPEAAADCGAIILSASAGGRLRSERKGPRCG